MILKRDEAEREDVTDPDPVPSAMQEARRLNDDGAGLDPVLVEPVADTLREVILCPKPENPEAPAAILEDEHSQLIDLEAMPTLGPSLVQPDCEVGEPTSLNDPVATAATVQMSTEDRPETRAPKQFHKSEAVNKITWPLIGRVAYPGRYMFRFGWLTITAADLAIWKAYPNAAFTLIKALTPLPDGVEEELAGEEFCLGTFELRIDSNYSKSEK